MAKRLNCICIDSSKHSAKAFDWYVNNYHHHGDVVGLLHVHQMPDLPIMGSMDYSMPISNNFEKIINASLQESRQLLNMFEEKCKEANLEFKVLETDCKVSPGHEICHLAKENGANAIIMGQRGVNKIRRMLLGSTSDYVVHHAHIPVTVVPTDNHHHH